MTTLPSFPMMNLLLHERAIIHISQFGKQVISCKLQPITHYLLLFMNFSTTHMPAP